MSKLSREEENALSDAYIDLLVTSSRLLKGLIPAQQVPVLKEWAIGAIRSQRSSLMRAGLNERWIEAVQMPIVALVDEAARRSPEAGLQNQWPSLQFDLYGHEDLGQQVFAELQKLRSVGSTPLAVLSFYQRCLSFGLQGQYQDHPRQLADIFEKLEQDIRLRRPRPSPMSPDLHSAKTTLGPAPTLGSIQIMLCAAAATCLLILCLFALLKMQVSGTEQRLADINPIENILPPGGTP